MSKKALITGITGQDGSYLADLLLAKGYEVHGIIRRASTFNTSRIDHLYQDPHVNGVKLFLHYGDLSDAVHMTKLLYDLQPDEVYNLGAQSHVRVSFDIPEYTADVTGVGTIRILEAIRESGVKPRFYQASSSEMFGKVQEIPQKETTPFWPRSPYGCAKMFGHWATVNYRESYNLFACSGEHAQLEGWLAWAERSRLAVFRDLARSLKRHRDGVLAYMETKLTNGPMEAVNGLLQLAKRIARGFRNCHYFRLAAYLKAGGLNLRAPRLLPT